ncbi:hypothetical protein LJC63_11515, partial [Ruminococcaceae bacterium OttesenSCG-928-L11]|nr:hypothetical protein [Ruminococcaceae bacterium OttesenSCG-928-L11]
MQDIRDVIGTKELYEYNVSFLRSVGEQYQISTLRKVQKKGLETPKAKQKKTKELTPQEKKEYAKLEASVSRS